MVNDVGLPLDAGALSYTLEKFEGPLDLLLHLIQKAKVNIYDIPIAQITDQFLEYLKGAEELSLDVLSEFYQMAAHLLYMKSRMLLPSFDSIEEDEEFSQLKSDLIDSLIEYQKFKRYSSLLATSQEEGSSLSPVKGHSSPSLSRMRSSLGRPTCGTFSNPSLRCSAQLPHSRSLASTRRWP